MSAYKPIRKILAGLAAGVLLPGIFLILNEGIGLISLTPGAWAALLASTFLPLLTAYLVPSKQGEAAPPPPKA